MSHQIVGLIASFFVQRSYQQFGVPRVHCVWISLVLFYLSRSGSSLDYFELPQPNISSTPLKVRWPGPFRWLSVKGWYFNSWLLSADKQFMCGWPGNDKGLRVWVMGFVCLRQIPVLIKWTRGLLLCLEIVLITEKGKQENGAEQGIACVDDPRGCHSHNKAQN